MRKIRIYLPQYGQIKVYDADHLPIIPGVFDAPILEKCSKECLKALEQRVAATRAAEGKSRDEQREDLRKAADQARGYGLYRENDNDSSSDGYKAHEGTTTVAMNRSDAATLNPHSDSLFTNPANGLEYNKKEIYALAGGNDLQRKI